MKKGEIYEGVITEILFPNKGVVHLPEGTVIVKNGIPGQKIRFRIHKKRKDRAEGILLDVLEPSPEETVDAGCGIFPACGGCMYRTMPYAAQLRMKEKQVRGLMEEALKRGGQVREDGSADLDFEGIIPSPCEQHYRNKMEYSFGDAEKNGALTLGLHKKGSTYDVLTAANCRIVEDDFNRILRCVLDFCREQGWSYYHKMSHRGFLRHLLIRRAAATQEILVDLVTSTQYPGVELQKEGVDSPDSGDLYAREKEKVSVKLQELCKRVCNLQLDGSLVGFLHTRNDAVADVIRDEGTDVLYGRGFFYEELLGLQFKITPFSFFQTNSKGAERLYETARKYLGEIENQVVFDLYSGTGTIAQMLAPAAKKVIGVEIVEEAVEAAKENAERNGLTNCTFIAGDVLKVLDQIEDRPDVLVLDPPRDGIHPKALPKLIAYGVRHIVYISCKPTSLARDLEIFLAGGYRVEKMCCVDMFPHTVHVETVCLLSKHNMNV